MYNPEKLEKYAQVIYSRYEYFNNYTLGTIGRRIKATGALSAADRQALKNIADISGDMGAITKKLAEITRLNISDIERIYEEVITDGVNTYKPLYDFKGMRFVPFEKNEYARQLVGSWAKETAGEMINLSRTKALCFDRVDAFGNAVGSTPLAGAFQEVIDEAVAAVSAGTVNFNTAMAKTVERLGGSGVKVSYGNGVNRSLSAVIRQNILYGAKRSAQSYDEHIGKVLGCDGFEVDAHPGCRPSHEFMQGKMYSYSGRKIVGGTVYEDGAEALERLEDYNCLHFKTDVILGVSQPSYSAEELERIHKESTELIEYNGREKTLYEWKRTQRAFERSVRGERQKADMLDAAGMKRRAQECRQRADAYRRTYDDMCSKVKGLEPHPERMRVWGSLTKDGSGGMINKAKSATEVQDVHYIGKIDRNIYQRAATGKVLSDDVVITDNRIQHIIERRGQEFYDKYKNVFAEIISDPDYIFKDKMLNTAIAAKTFIEDDMSINIVVRLIVEGENISYKNSIITAIKESDKRFKQRLRNNTLLYRKKY